MAKLPNQNVSEMSDKDFKFGKIYKLSVTALRINGSYPLIDRNKFWVFQVIFVSAINLFMFFLLCNSVLMHDIRTGNLTIACKNISLAIICTNTYMKYLVLLYHRQSMIDLIRVVDNDYKLAKKFPTDEQIAVKRYADEGRLICLLWFLFALTGGTMFPLKAIILTACSFWHGENKLVPIFDLTFPDMKEKHKNAVAAYWGEFVISCVFTFLSAIMYVGFDPLIPIFTLYTCGQLDSLSQRIKKALSKDETIENMEENLKIIIIKLQELYRFVNRVQTNFTLLNEFNMKSTTIFLPIVAFHLVEDIRCNIINYEFFIIFIGANVHFLMPCYYSDLLMERGEAFRQAIYSCGWENHPNKSIRQTVLFMLTRATRPLCISTVFHNICLDTFATMMRQSYALFNLMNAAWAK